MSYLNNKKIAGYAMSLVILSVTIAVTLISNSLLNEKIQEENKKNKTTVSVILTEEKPTTENPTNGQEVPIKQIYKDGIFISKQSYNVKDWVDTTDFTLEIKEGKIVNMSAKWVNGNSRSVPWVVGYQNKVSPEIYQKDLDSISSVYVSGSTRTSNAFEKAVADIKLQAKNE